MKKLALILGVAGCFSVASADIVRTFDHDFEESYGSDIATYPAFAYGDDGVSVKPAPTGFGSGNVFEFKYILDGAWASSGIGFAFPDWAVVDASTLTGIKICLRSTLVDTIKVSLKSSADTAYDLLGLQGISYDAILDGTKEGVSTILLPADFKLPSWWSGTVKPGNPDDASKAAAQAWVGGKTTALMNAKRTSVLSKLTSIQISVGCKTCADVAGSILIDSLIIQGVKIEGDDWHDDNTIASVRSHRIQAQALRATIDGSMLKVVKPEAASASLELVRLDGSKVASWTVSGTKAAVALPAGLEKGAYFAVLTTAGHKTTASVSVVR